MHKIVGSRHTAKISKHEISAERRTLYQEFFDSYPKDKDAILVAERLFLEFPISKEAGLEEIKTLKSRYPDNEKALDLFFVAYSLMHNEKDFVSAIVEKYNDNTFLEDALKVALPVINDNFDKALEEDDFEVIDSVINIIPELDVYIYPVKSVVKVKFLHEFSSILINSGKLEQALGCLKEISSFKESEYAEFGNKLVSEIKLAQFDSKIRILDLSEYETNEEYFEEALKVFTPQAEYWKAYCRSLDDFEDLDVFKDNHEAILDIIANSCSRMIDILFSDLEESEYEECAQHLKYIGDTLDVTIGVHGHLVKRFDGCQETVVIEKINYLLAQKEMDQVYAVCKDLIGIMASDLNNLKTEEEGIVNCDFIKLLNNILFISRKELYDISAKNYSGEGENLLKVFDMADDLFKDSMSNQIEVKLKKMEILLNMTMYERLKEEDENIFRVLDSGKLTKNAFNVTLVDSCIIKSNLLEEVSKAIDVLNKETVHIEEVVDYLNIRELLESYGKEVGNHISKEDLYSELHILKVEIRNQLISSLTSIEEYFESLKRVLPEHIEPKEQVVRMLKEQYSAIGNHNLVKQYEIKIEENANHTF